jgi:MscS family membrane protein
MKHQVLAARIARARRWRVGLAAAAVVWLTGATPAPGAQDAAEPISSPRGAAQAFLDACREGRYGKAARHLDVRNFDASEGPGLARRFSVVLDQKLWFDLERISPTPEGDLEDNLPPGVERVGGIRTANGEVDVLMERVTLDSGTAVWKFASSTVDRIPALYDEFGYGALGELLPEPFFRLRFLDVTLWQWLGLLLAVLLAYLASWVTTWIVYRTLRSFVSRTETRIDDALLDIAVKPFRLVLATAFFFAGVIILRLAAPARAFLGNLLQALVIVAVTWLLLRLVDGFRDQFKQRLEQEGKLGAVAVIPLGVRTVKAFLVVLAAIAMLQHLGFNVTGIIAGLGVGGIALALAAQKSIENLFGGVTLIADQPVRVGDFCRFGDKLGTVEDVGLRSTRVRTPDRTVLTIPNGDFSQTQIENFGERDRIRLFCMLGLRYETTPDQLRHVITGLRRLLVAHPKVTPDPARVRFVGFGAYSLDLEVFAYVATADWNEFLAVREDIFLRMMEIVAESGTGFAFPSNTTYLARDGGMDKERTREAEHVVRQWREESKLPFPGLGAETISELEDTLDYPPRGTVAIDVSA